MGRSTPLCHTCQQRVSAKGDQGLTCGSCTRADHFKFLKLSEAKKTAILSGEQCYLCDSCKNKQRLSLSFVADTSPKAKKVTRSVSVKTVGSSLNSKAGPSKAKVNPVQEKTTSGDETLVSTLLATVQALTETVKNLEKKLEQALSQQKQRPNGSDKVKSPKSRLVSFTINGVPEKKYKDPREIVEKVIKTIDHTNTLDSSAVVKKLSSKDNARPPVILISLNSDSESLSTLKQLKRRKLSGQDIDIPNCEQIFVNESYPTQVYKLLKEAKKLKQHGYRFVWVQNNRVLVRLEENSPVVQIKDTNHLESIISSVANTYDAEHEQ